MPLQVTKPSIAPQQIDLCTQMPIVNGTAVSDVTQVNLHPLHKFTAPVVIKVSGQFVRPGSAQSQASFAVIQGSLDNVTWCKVFTSDMFYPGTSDFRWETVQPHSATVSGFITISVIAQLYPYMRAVFTDTGVMTGAFATVSILDR